MNKIVLVTTKNNKHYLFFANEFISSLEDYKEHVELNEPILLDKDIQFKFCYTKYHENDVIKNPDEPIQLRSTKEIMFNCYKEEQWINEYDGSNSHNIEFLFIHRTTNNKRFGSHINVVINEVSIEESLFIEDYHELPPWMNSALRENNVNCYMHLEKLENNYLVNLATNLMINTTNTK